MGKEKQLKQQVKWGKEKMWYHTEIIVFPYLFEIKSHYVSYCVLDCGDCRHSPPCPAFAILILREDKLPSVGQADKGYLSGDLVFHPKERWGFFFFCFKHQKARGILFSVASVYVDGTTKLP